MYNKSQATSLIEQELSLFPKSTLTDIYKLFFQNSCGSNHFFKSITEIKSSMEKEITKMKKLSFSYPTYDISYILPVKRFSLKDIYYNKFDVNFVADRFFALSINEMSLNSSQWEKEWSEISLLTLTIKKDIVNDLNETNLDYSQATHHSSIYKENYHPHYRIGQL